MAHGIKKILIDKQEEMECNNNHQQTMESLCKSKLALNSLLLLDNCCHSSSNQNLLNQKNSSATNTNALIATHHSLPPPTHATTTTTTTLMNNSNGNKLTLNCSGASMSTITSSVVATTTTTTKSLLLSSSSSSSSSATAQTSTPKMGSRRIFTPQFKLQVLESYRSDNDCKGNQRATARKYGIHRRQIQKWLQCENNLRSIIANNPQNVRNNALKSISKATAPILSQATSSRHRGVAGANTDKNGATYSCFTLANVKGYKASCSGIGSTPTSATTKSLSSSSSLSSSFGDFTCGGSSNATAIETNKNLSGNLNFYFDNSHMSSIYGGSGSGGGKSASLADDVPIDLSCNGHQQQPPPPPPHHHTTVKIKVEPLARPIALHPSKIPFYNYATLAQSAAAVSPAIASSSSAASSPRLIDISNPVQQAANPIDLSVPSVSHKRKYSTDNSSSSSGDDNKKPIKLFRPYLEGNFDNDEMKKQQQQQQQQQQPKVEKEDEDDVQKFPIVWSNAYNFYSDHIHQSDYHPFLVTSPRASFYSPEPHRLAIPINTPPSSSLSSPNDSGIVMNTSFQTLLPPSQASPVSGYDSSTSSIYSFNDNEVDLSQGNSPPYTSSHYDAPSPISSATMSPSVETKVPLSTSSLSSSFLHDLKFKLRALDCYYNDADCKRNEKLVANKLKINCKIVEKWLRQESDLRHQQKQYHLQILV